MKNIMLLVGILMLSGFAAEAQYYYYNGPTAVGDSVTYNIKVAVGPVIELSNTNNRCDTIKRERLDGAKINTLNKREYYTKNGYTIDNAIDVAFEAEHIEWFFEKNSMRPAVIMVINPQTGDVLEVRFMFNNETKWGTIPPDEYYNLEKTIKQNIRFALTNDDKNYNIISILW